MNPIKEQYLSYTNTLTELQEKVQTVKEQFFNAQRLLYEPQIINSGLPYRFNRDGVLEPQKEGFRDVDGGFGDYRYAYVDKEGVELDKNDPRLGIFRDLKEQWQTLVDKPLNTLIQYERENAKFRTMVENIELGTAALLSERGDDHAQVADIIQKQLDNLNGQIIFEDPNTPQGKLLKEQKEKTGYALSFVQELEAEKFNAQTPSNDANLSI